MSNKSQGTSPSVTIINLVPKAWKNGAPSHDGSGCQGVLSFLGLLSLFYLRTQLQALRAWMHVYVCVKLI